MKELYWIVPSGGTCVHFEWLLNSLKSAFAKKKK